MKETSSHALYEKNEFPSWPEQAAGQINSMPEHQSGRISRRSILMSLGAGTIALGTAASYLLFSGRLQMALGHLGTSDTLRMASQTSRAIATPAVDSYKEWVQTHGMMSGFDAQHTHFNPYEDILNTSNVSSLTQVWYSNAIGGNIFSSPTVSGELLYIGTLGGRLYALDAATGKTRWASNTATSSSTSNDSTPAIINGVVYICLQDRSLYAFDALSGQLLWSSFNNVNNVDSSPTIANGVVYVTGQDRVYAFNAETGHIRWVSPPTGNTHAAAGGVAVANTMAYVSMVGSGAGTGQVYAFDVSTGHVRWASDLINGGIDINSSPTVAKGMVYIGSGNGGLAAFDATTGHVRWVSPPTAGSTGSSPAVANGIVYLAEDRVYAFDATSGQKRWVTSPIGVYNADSPMVANGVIYVCSAGNNSVYALDAATGHTLWISPPANNQIFTTPTVANGRVYAASSDGALYAFSLPR